MKIVVALDDHPVYESIYRVLNNTGMGEVSKFKEYRKNLRYLLRMPSFHIQSLNIAFSKNDLYVLNSPIMAAEAWKAKRMNINAIFVEEYYNKFWLKDIIVGKLLKQFKSYPFIAMTKRTYEFLLDNDIPAFLIPPATKKRNGKRRRDIILSVSRMVESKNIPFVLDIARNMKKEHFVIIGSGPLFNVFKKKIDTLPNVEIIEFVEHERLFLDYYSKAKMLIHPAKSDPIGFSVIEALSTSTPTLVSKGTGASDYLPSEWVFENYDINKWIVKISEIDEKDSNLAKKVFEKEHLNINDAYFEIIAKKLRQSIEKRC